MLKPDFRRFSGTVALLWSLASLVPDAGQLSAKVGIFAAEEDKYDMAETTVLDFYYNDPSETELHGILVVPTFPEDTPEFTVVGWKGLPERTPGTPGYQAAQVWGAMASTLSYVMNIKRPSYLTAWSSTYNLVAIPRAGEQLNAYYDRSSLRFFWGTDPQTKRAIYTCDSVGIVSHELGHAILDAMRPDLWNTAVLEFFAFHEAFGDILAIATVLQHDMVIEQMFAETTNPQEGIPNLWQCNVVSRLARELGHAIYYSSNMTIGAEKYLRNAFNDFKYVDPLTLPLGVSDLILSQEPHNFSRVFSGAWYECFCELFKNNYKIHNPTEALIAVKNARDTMISALFEAVKIAPSQLQFLQTMAMTIVQVMVKQKKIMEADIVKKVFIGRNLWVDAITVQTNSRSLSMTTTTTSAGHEVTHMTATIGASLTHASQDVIVELPKFIYLQSGQDPQTTMMTSVTAYLNYISSQNFVGLGTDNMFGLKDGQLQRNYICSSFKAKLQRNYICSSFKANL